MLRTISIAVVAASISAPTAPPQSESTKAIISGYIIDAVGCPVAGATITLHPAPPPWDGPVLQQTRSDPQGRFEFPPADLADYLVAYEYTDESYGAGGGRDRVHLRAGGTSIGFQLTPGSPLDEVHLRVVVTDRDDAPISGARVTWQRLVAGQESTCATGSMVTGADGRAEQEGISKGLYRLTVDADGFVPTSYDQRLRGAFGPYRFELMTLAEAAKAKKWTRIKSCCGVAPPRTISALVSGTDAVIVGRVLRAVTELANPADENSDVRTRYQIQVLEAIKPHVQLPTAGRAVNVVHDAGELELQDTLVLGCERTTLKEDGVYVLFLDWNAGAATFHPSFINALVANITSGKVMTLGKSHVALVIAERQGKTAEAFLGELRAAMKAAQ